MNPPPESESQPTNGGQKFDGNPYEKVQTTLDWSRSDIERRLGFKGGRFTTPNTTLGFIIGLLATVVFFSMLMFALQRWPQVRWLTAMFLERGFVPYPIMLLFFWGLALLTLKSRKMALQGRSLSLPIMPQQPDFVLTPATSRALRGRIAQLVDNPSHFVLLNRIDLALANLHNIGRPADVATILKIQGENDENQFASGYGIVTGFLWAIPVLGFIGTVLGLSHAIQAFTGTLQSGGDLGAIREALQSVTGGLSTAFETTLVALVCALILQLRVSFLQSHESEFLDSCNEICHKHVAGRLRLEPAAGTES